MLRILSFIRGFLYSEFPLTEVPLYTVVPVVEAFLPALVSAGHELVGEDAASV